MAHRPGRSSAGRHEVVTFSPLQVESAPLSTHALGSSESSAGISVLRYLDLVLLAVALPVFVLAGLPLVGYAAAAGAWLLQRAIQLQTDRRARASDDPRVVAGLLAGSMLARGWLVALAVFGVGMAAEREDGLAAAVLCISLFTAYFSATMLTRPFERPSR